MSLPPLSFRAQVKVLALDRVEPREIARRLSRSNSAVQRMTYKLRLAGELPPVDAVDPTSLPGRALALITAAGDAGRSAAALQAELVCAPPDLRRALRRLCEIEAAREDSDARYRSVRAQAPIASVPVATVAVQNRAIEDVVGHALLIAQRGQRERASAFLCQACGRLPPGKFEEIAVNWLAIADLIRAPETLAAGGGLRGYGAGFAVAGQG